MPSTAIKRTKPSTPLKFLLDKNLIDPSEHILDYGCGFGTDAAFLRCDMWDPTYYSKSKFSPPYDKILCTYVLNTLHTKESMLSAIYAVRYMLKDDGRAYFTVRRDKKALKGETSRGFQCFVTMEGVGCTLIETNPSFAIYEVKKSQPIEVHAFICTSTGEQSL